MYNFGSPRVGNKVFHSLYKRHIMDSFLVQVDGDLVTGTPFSDAINKYEHHGPKVLIDGLDASGSIIINPTSIELRLRARAKTSVTGHSTVTYLKGLAAVVDSVRQFSEEKDQQDQHDHGDEDAMVGVEDATGAVLAKYDSIRSTVEKKSGSLFKFSNKIMTRFSATNPRYEEEEDIPRSPPVEIEIDHPDAHDFGMTSVEIDR